MQLQDTLCIIGNGAVGKAAALAFAQAGYGVTLLCDPASHLPVRSPAAWDVRVYAVNRATRDLLSSIRVWDAMDASRIEPVDAMEVNGDGAQGAGMLHFDAYAARTDALAWIVEDANLAAALDTALKFTPNIRIVV